MDDLISRAEAVKAICGDCVWYNTASCEGEEWECDSVNKLRSLPSAEAEDRPTGEWEQVPYKRQGHEEVITDGHSWRCSNCGDARKRNQPDMRFCPNCGSYNGGESDDKG